MKGACKQMGMIWKQNKALTSALVMAACTVAEACWHSPIGNESREKLKDVICFMLAAFAFGAGLRGDEVP